MTAGAGATGASARGVLIVACVSSLIVNANTSAVTILLPSISDDTGASTDFLQWAVTGYSLVGAAVIVTSGALGDVFGRRKVFIGGLLLFIASCAFIALSGSGGGVVAGRAIQGASGATLLACGMSLLSVASSGEAQMRALSIWGAASAVGAAAGPLLAGLLVDSTGWQGLFWIDAAIAAICVPLTLRWVAESSDPDRLRSIDWAGTALIAVALVPLILAFTEGADWGWLSVGIIACFAVSIAAILGFLAVERRASAPLVDLSLLRNQALVGSTVAILLAAGAINALMYVISLYFQDPDGLGMSALEAGIATLPAAAGMIVIATAVAKLASRIGPRPVILIGFAVMAASFGTMALVTPSWGYGLFVLPIIGIAIGMGFANGPASSVATSSVPASQVGAASGISNMARYVGAAIFTAAIAAIYSGTVTNQTDAGESASDALATAVSHSALALALISLAGIAAAVLKSRRHRRREPEAIDYAAHAAAPAHTLPVSRAEPAAT